MFSVSILRLRVVLTLLTNKQCFNHQFSLRGIFDGPLNCKFGHGLSPLIVCLREHIRWYKPYVFCTRGGRPSRRPVRKPIIQSIICTLYYKVRTTITSERSSSARKVRQLLSRAYSQEQVLYRNSHPPKRLDPVILTTYI